MPNERRVFVSSTASTPLDRNLTWWSSPYATSTHFNYNYPQGFVNRVPKPYTDIIAAHKDILGCDPSGHYLARVSPRNGGRIAISEKDEFNDWDCVWEVDAAIPDTALKLDRLVGEDRIMLIHLFPWKKPEHDGSSHLSYEQMREYIYGPVSVEPDMPDGVVLREETRISVNRRTQEMLRDLAARRENMGE